MESLTLYYITEHHTEQTESGGGENGGMVRFSCGGSIVGDEMYYRNREDAERECSRLQAEADDKPQRKGVIETHEYNVRMKTICIL